MSRYLRPPDLAPLLAVGARFHAGAAPLLLRTPASELADAHVPLDALIPRLAARLDDRLLHAADRPAAFAAELGRALRDVDVPDRHVLAAVRLLDAGEPVAGVAERTFVNERALQRRFAEHVGYGPKTLQRVLRFQRFLRAAPRLPLARAASLAGYADQSHLTRETRRLTGLTPRRLQTWTH
jgi:AraC-like DNA-binding protein